MNANRLHLLSFLAIALFALGAARTFDVWFSFSTADAFEDNQAMLGVNEQTPTQIATQADNGSTLETNGPEASRRVLEALAERRAEIELKEAELETRAAIILAAEAQLSQRIDEYEKIRADVEYKLDQRSAEREAQLSELVSAYERMRAKDAAVIFNQLDHEILLAVASEMRPQSLASILAAMDPARASVLTVSLAGDEPGPSLPQGAK